MAVRLRRAAERGRAAVGRTALFGLLALAAPAFGEPAAGDLLQLGYNLWLVGHQLGDGEAPWRDPYSFQPVVDPPPNLQGWLFGLPFWPLHALLGAVGAWNAFVLLSY